MTSLTFHRADFTKCTLGLRAGSRKTRVVHSQSYSSSSGSVTANMGPELKGAIDRFVSDNKIVVFMKGTAHAPKCGFSNTVVQIFKSLEVPFETVDILESEELRVGMKLYSGWPTFPQVYVDGEFYGGCDICIGALPCASSSLCQYSTE